MAKVIYEAVTDFFGIIDVLAPNQKVITLTDVISFIDENIYQAPFTEIFNDNLSIFEGLHITGKSLSIFLSDTINIIDKSWRVNEINIIDKLGLLDSTFRFHPLLNNIIFTDSFIIVHTTDQFFDTISFTDSIAYSKIYFHPIIVIDTLLLTDMI